MTASILFLSVTSVAGGNGFRNNSSMVSRHSVITPALDLDGITSAGKKAAVSVSGMQNCQHLCDCMEGPT